ncbi:MAG: preprotein translocase subunit SecE [Thermaurantiacus sp.]
MARQPTGTASDKPAAKAPKPSPGEFVRQVKAEMDKVTWPTRPETLQTTIMVLIMTTLLALFFLAVDFALGRGVRLLLSLGG